MTKLSNARLRWLLATTLAASLASGAAEARTVGVSLSKADAFITMLKDSIVDRAKTVGGVDLKVADAAGDPDKQMEILKGFVDAKVDAMVVIAVDGDQGAVISKMAQDAGIPLVFLNNQPINVEELVAGQTYVGSDETESGTLQAAEVCRLLGGKGHVAVMMGELLHFAARTRTTDVDNVLAGQDCSGIKVVERQSANWSRDQAAGLAAEWVRAGAKFDAIIANNDEMALGAIRGLKASGVWNDRMIVAGIDATKDALNALKAGDMKVTILQSASGQGAGAVDAALKLAAGENVPTKVFIPFELVTPANVETYLASQ